MGGEPTVHSSFEEIIAISQAHFESIIIFTNALNDRILNIHPRSDDAIVYNFRYISSRFNKGKFLTDQPGRRRIEVQISSKTNIESIINRLLYFKDIPNLKINLTLDCMEDVFENKYDLQRNFATVSNFINNNLERDYIIDHIIPSCLFEDFKTPDALCSIKCAGLIDSSLKLRYCNQFEKPLCDILDASGEFIPFDQIVSQLKDGYEEKISISRSKRCNECKYFLERCNGGCFVHKTL